MAGPARSRPKPSGPTCSTSLAKAGSSAVAPPSSTANRSSEIAPRMMLVGPDIAAALRRSAPSGCRAGVAAGYWLRIESASRRRRRRARPVTRIGRGRARSATSRPPSQGPTITATSSASERIEIARGISAIGTSIGTSAVEAGPSQARAAPNSAAMTKIGQIAGDGCSASASQRQHADDLDRRARRSTMRCGRGGRRWCRPISVSRNIGTNCASPTMPT